MRTSNTYVGTWNAITNGHNNTNLHSRYYVTLEIIAADAHLRVARKIDPSI